MREGKVGQYWYHEDTQAFFDDSDHYKMIKAMCRLTCSECDRMEDQGEDGSRRRTRFRNIDQLKGHLFHKHMLIMCSLCLEGRKVHYISWLLFAANYCYHLFCSPGFLLFIGNICYIRIEVFYPLFDHVIFIYFCLEVLSLDLFVWGIRHRFQLFDFW